MTTLQKKPNAAPAPAARPSTAGRWPLRFHVIKAVFDRNFQAYFSNPTGYVFVILFVLASVWAAIWRPEFFANNLANLGTLNDWMPYLLLFFIPAITMSVWAEERRQGTDELLLTLPARDIEVVLGKYFAAVGIYTAALVFSFPLVLVLYYLGSPDPGILLCTYLGYWLMGAMMIAVGLVASLLSANATVAFILGALFNAVPVFIGLAGLAFAPATRRTIEDLSIPSQFRDLGTGVVSASSVFYFVSLAVAMLYLNMILLGRRQWAGGQRSRGLVAHNLVRVVALIVAVVAGNFLISKQGWRLDASAEQVYTLSPESKAVIAGISADRPVYIQAYYSAEVPRDFVIARDNLLNKLREYAALGGDKVRLNLIQTELFSNEARDAQKRFGIEPRRVVSAEEARQSASEIFLGVAFTSGLEEVVVPFFDPGLPTEYELTRSIRVVSKAGRKKVGILATDAKMLGGFDFRQMGQETEWPFVTELKKQYEVSSVAADGPMPGDLDVLLVAQPSSLNQKQLDALTDYVRAGHPTLLFMDPLPMFNPMLSSEVPKMPPGGMMGGQPPEPKGNMQPLLDALGVDSNGGEIVWNSYNPLLAMPDLYPEFVFVGKGSGGDNAFNPAEPASSGLQEVVIMFGGTLRPKGSSPEFIPLMQVGGIGGAAPFNQVVQMGMMGQITGINPLRPFVPDNMEHVLAARIKGKAGAPAAGSAEAEADLKKPGQPKPTGGEVNAIVIADLDLISEDFFGLRRRRSEKENLDFDNIPFVLNCVDVLAGDDAYITLRKRRPKYRTLARFEQLTRDYVRQAQKETKQAEDEEAEALKKAQAALDAKVAKVRQDKELDEASREQKLLTLQKVATRQLEVETAGIKDETRRKRQDIKANREEKTRELETGVRVATILAAPLPVLLLAALIFGVRASRENKGANPNRLA